MAEYEIVTEIGSARVYTSVTKRYTAPKAYETFRGEVFRVVRSLAGLDTSWGSTAVAKSMCGEVRDFIPRRVQVGPEHTVSLKRVS